MFWGDGYISYTDDSGTSRFFTSNLPIWEPGVIFRDGVELLAGGATHITARLDTVPGTGLAVMPDGRYVTANAWQDNKKVYYVGEEHMHTVVGNGIPIDSLYAYGKDFTFITPPIIESTTDVRIAFTYTPTLTWVDELLIWNGTAFEMHPITSFPAMGQDLSVLSDIRIPSNTMLYYVLFITVPDDYTYFEIDWRMEYVAVAETVSSPVPLNNVPATGSAKLIMPPGAAILTNTTGRDIENPRIVVYGGK
jgi:hypothetical protein